MAEDTTIVTHTYLQRKMEQVKSIVDGQFRDVRDEVKENKDNIKDHEKLFNSLNNKVTGIENDVAWLKKFFWIVAGSSVGALLTNLINLLN